MHSWCQLRSPAPRTRSRVLAATCTPVPGSRSGRLVPLAGHRCCRVDSLVTRPYVGLGMPAAVGPTATPRLDLLDPAEVARLGGLEVVTEGIVEGFLAGLHRSPRRGLDRKSTRLNSSHLVNSYAVC